MLYRRIKIVPKVRSINGVFLAVDETLEETDYNPPYQRNYVWDDEKATYFIETIFLGSEVPPIILFKSSTEDGFIHYEVIDGKQRYQTIVRFLNDELKLKKNGLQKLGKMSEFVGKTFSELSDKYKNLFKDTKIRTIEYSFVGDSNTEDEESLKREIFQRYNSGITPLRSYELDKARYFNNDLNQSIKELLSENAILDSKVTDIFLWDKLNIDQKVAKIRELLILHRIPIQYYAIQKQTVISKYFEYISTQLEDDKEELLDSFSKKIDALRFIKDKIIESGIPYNRLYAQCLFWAFSVMEENNVSCDIIDNNVIYRLTQYLLNHTTEFTTIRSSFYSVLLGRYRCIANFFEETYHCSFKFAIENNENFKKTNQSLSASSSSSSDSIEDKSFEQLRINKPEPTSVELTELMENLKSSCFILRPPYQRGEVRNKKKSSAIIESMLLGVMLPPIFVFKRKDGVSEVIDGQQRLLSIISYIGESYRDENGDSQKPLLHNFKLDLGSSAVLKDLKGLGYNQLSKLDQNKIRKTSIFIIEIREDQNSNFDPVDLFVRLNNKPYPIPKYSFEMWNSFAPRSIIKLIKDAVKSNEKWFYFRKNNTRMDNENIYATLAYFQYMYKRNGIESGKCAPEKTIETYGQDNHVACRFRSRHDITELLYNDNVCDNVEFIEASNKIEFDFVCNLRAVLSNFSSDLELNKGLDGLLSVENGKRTQMSFYILWILLHDMPSTVLRKNHLEAFREIKSIYRMTDTDTCTNVTTFTQSVSEFRNKYGYPLESVLCPLNRVAVICDNKTDEVGKCIRLVRKMKDSLRFNAESAEYIAVSDDVMNLIVDRAGFRPRYIEAFLRSRLFSYYCGRNNAKLTRALFSENILPFVSESIQAQVEKVLTYVDSSHLHKQSYFERLLDVLFYELTYPYEFKEHEIDIMSVVKEMPSLESLNENERYIKVDEIYAELISTDHLLGMYLMKVIDIDTVRRIENDEKDSQDNY